MRPALGDVQIGASETNYPTFA